MATIEITDTYREPLRLRLTITLPGIFAAWLSRRRERRLYARFARRSPHLIRDIGLDPDAVHEVVAGTWDQLDPRRPRIR